MNWNEYIEKIKNGPIPINLCPPTKEDCDVHGKFLAFFHKEKPAVWGYLNVNYIEKNDPYIQPGANEAGYYPLHMICSHWLPVPPPIGG